MAESAKDPKQSKVTVDIDRNTPAPQSAGRLTRFDEFERDLERMFEGFMSRNWLRPLRDFPTLRDLPSLRGGFDFAHAPKVDVIERDHEIAVRAELPGVDKKDLKVSLTDRSVTIRASTRTETTEEKGEYFRREIGSGEFSRTLALPADVDGPAARAEFKDGLLEIVVPKITKAKRVDVEVK